MGFRAMVASRRGWCSAAIAAILVLMAGPAFACSCSSGGNPDMLVLGAPLAFRGRVVAVEALDNTQAPRQRATVEVTQLWKGDLPARVELSAGGSDSLCGVHLSVGDERAFFPGRFREGGLGISQCSMWAAREAEPALSRLGEQLSAADAAVRANPDAMAPLLRRAEALRRWRDHDRALTAYQAVVAAAPDLVSGQTGMARVLLGQGRAAEAVTVLERAKARLGAHPELLGTIALAHAAMGDFQDLSQADFRDADLSNIDLSRQVLRGADFSGTYLSRVRLEQSDLRGARFEGTRFAGVDMQRADLRGASFIASLGFPYVLGADLREARLERIDVPEGFSFRDVDMRGATLLESQFRSVDFVGVNLRGARLTTVHMRRGDFVWSSLDGAVLRNVTFSAVYMTEAPPVPRRLLSAPSDLPGVRLIDVRFEP
ncbi:pentapeptide repeat-containing protein [Neoroseomonas lacus]|uniref:pentapeptide repeat-containing protein n=1 Tax=Neoroseomonas lacus TaxID=287609 RepID=UPI001663E113|nr:pentapeptide repeat-containing protein [Neoroseomonas lacus]